MEKMKKKYSDSILTFNSFFFVIIFKNIYIYLCFRLFTQLITILETVMTFKRPVTFSLFSQHELTKTIIKVPTLNLCITLILKNPAWLKELKHISEMVLSNCNVLFFHLQPQVVLSVVLPIKFQVCAHVTHILRLSRMYMSCG